VITDPSDPEVVPSAAPLQDTFVALAMVTLGSKYVTVVVAVQSPSAFPV
jgi:hypothetical protein